MRDAAHRSEIFSLMSVQGHRRKSIACTLWSGSPQLGTVADLALKSRLPAIYHYRQFAMAGGLMSYGPSLPALDKLLKGANPTDLPVEQPTRFELVINMRTAAALGFTVPPLLLARADEVIE